MLSFLAFIFLSTSYSQEKIQIKNFTPQGTVKSVSQVRIEFAKPMVKLGEFSLEAPAQSACFKEGQGRWVDTRNWVFDFTKPLKGGVLCDVKVHGQSYQFNTGGPHIENTFPRLYQPIDADQNFVVILDSPIRKESLSGAYFVMEGLGDQIPVIQVEGSEAEQVKEAAKHQYQYEKENFDGNWIVIKAKRSFPAGAKVTLVWSKAVQSSSGMSSKEDETFEYTVQEAFKAEFNCNREAPGKPCVPLLPMTISFTAPISVKDVKRMYLESANGKKIAPLLNENDADSDFKSYVEFKGPFPEKVQMKLMIPGDIKDDQGRALTNKGQFPLIVKTGDNPALLKFAANFGIIEADPSAAVAVTLRRVEKNVQTKYAGWTGQWKAANFKDIIQALSDLEREPSGAQPFKSWGNAPLTKIQVNKPLVATDTEVVGIPLKGSGFYVLEMASPLLGQRLLDKKAPYYVRTAALVTKMAVHLKFNQDQIWVWVTDLKTAQSVPGAMVSFYDVKGDRIAQATSDAQGLAHVKLGKSIDSLPRREGSNYYEGFFAVAEKGDDFSFTHSSWDRGVESWRFQRSMGNRLERLVGHAVLDRTLLKPEETMSAKVFLRKPNEAGLSLPDLKEWPTHLNIAHESGLQTFKIPLQWNKKKGTASLKWNIPAGAKLGRWILNLERKDPDLFVSVGDVRVENFRVPLLQVQVQAATSNFIQQPAIPVQISANYFSGGPASKLPMKVRWSVEPSSFNIQDDELQDYSFANGAVKEGLFRSGEEETARPIPQSGSQEITLDKTGGQKVELNKIKYAMAPQRLHVEAEYKDPNGEIQSSVRAFNLWPSSLVLGIKSKSWSATKDKVEFQIAALDLQQRPVKGQAVSISLYTSRYYSHRKRLVGGFYSYDSFQEVKKIGELCKGVTDAKGEFTCVGKSSYAGSVIAVASATDSQGRQAQANVHQWIVSKEEQQWFGPDDNDRADLIPFKKNYEPGETAEFQLRTPFPQARVLVTVERESVLYSEVVEVNSSKPVIRIPIKKEYAPNVVVSAFAIRGRLGDPKPTALVDLGKPAFKLGMSEIKVGWKENTLKVSVSSDKKNYKARDTAKVQVTVTDAQGRPASAGEVALVAVDEGLLELRDNSSWDILTAMMQMHQHLVKTATAQTLVIGKRHFGLKALPIGGDGRGGLRRELFDTLLYWNPNVTLNKDGKATVEVKLNDSTTSFRIVAIAQQKADQFGTGWTSIQSSQDLMILPGIASVARDGDDFNAGFTVRNATNETKEVNVQLVTVPTVPGLSHKKIRLEGGASQEVFWNIKTPSAEKIDYVLTARDAQGKFLDEIKKSQKILPLRQTRIYQSEFGQWPEFKQIAVQEPAGAESGQSSVIVEAASALGDSSSGVKEFWKNYQYTCLEQQISRAVSLNDKALWKKIDEKLGSYIDDRGLLKFFPGGSSNEGSVALTAYVVSLAHEAGFEISDDHEVRLLEALTNYSEGRLRESSASGRVDEVIKKISVFEALSRHRRLNIDLLSTVSFQGSQWPLNTLVEWYEILLWEKKVPGREQKLAEIENLLRNKFYFSSRKMLLKDENLDVMPWLMRDADGASLRLLLAVLNEPQWKTDLPRMIQGSLARQHDGAWMLTTANAWGRLATKKFDEVFQNEKVTGAFKASLDSVEKEAKWSQASVNLELPWKKSEKMVRLEQKGTGKPWITVSAKAALPITKPTFAGFTVEKEISAVEQKVKGQWSVGDTAKIQLKVKSQAPQTWVVIEDPIPAGSTVLTASWATAVERKAELIRFYQAWFPTESQTLEYTVRFNQAGTYKLPASRIEAMYSPDMFAELPESTWQVKE
ncbi:alpha-2-macroglobulin family protein [Bdellovibrio svalbardensis]|uniref:MG2 domain-containing protein n=1 Tax=Bdellovibrio svalbardensis TaxID=2972972 RepID=A0ABT6DK55_9BACT|nr:MG2 domain-containing protein [Bdellovibrio svalbardensis]MDG0817256.1 MG2 domain-containing protein [Bdellovibrio svalbardensis]